MGRHRKDCTCEICVKNIFDTAATPKPVEPVAKVEAVTKPEPGALASYEPAKVEPVTVAKISPAMRELELMASICAQCDELERRKILSFGPLFRLVRELRILKGGK